jgi:hypothetical protein
LLLAVFWDAQLVRWVVWVGLVVLTVALLLLIRTRWGQSQPLGKCVVLSLLAHLLVGIYATTVTIVTATVGSPEGEGVQVALVGTPGGEELDERSSAADALDSPAAAGTGESFATIQPTPLAAAPALPALDEPRRQTPTDAPGTLVESRSVEAPPSKDAGPPVMTTNDLIAKPLPPTSEPIDLPQSKDGDNLELVPPPEQPSAEPAPAPAKAADDVAKPSGNPPGETDAPSGGAASGGGRLSNQAPPGVAKPLPGVLQQRVGNHLGKGEGATRESETAVAAGLAWLAANQRTSGRWDARALGAGSGRAADGEERYSAGAQADTGITGLALLAFLAGGHTHLRGPHQTTVRRGLEFLLSVQESDGCLGSTTNRYERMYCHAMATCALSEAFAMTADERLQPAVRRAIGYTLQAQDRVTGGWRYMPSDPGDTSQLGWQLMALKSAELAGIPIPQATRDGISRFLRSVASGRSGGLACYQPSRPIASRSMTAEALVCRQFMGIVDSPSTQREASSFVLEELPGAGRTNHYYWYYATLGMYQLQGEPWRRWNEALQTNLLAAQRHDAALAGSWDPDPVWGGCGGRAYSTALATLCLEVYYRFLPLYVEAAGRERRTK